MKKSLAINKILERLQSRVTDKTPTSQLNMINHARRVLRGLESLESIADNPSPSATRDAHYLKVSQSAKRLQSEFAKIRDQLYDILVSEDSSKEERLNHLLKPTEHAAELRLVLRQMPLDERNKFILSAVQEGNIELLSAVRSAPAVLSGLTTEFHERVVGLAERAVAPEMLDQFNETIQIYDSCLVSLDTAEKTANEWNNPKKISDIQSKELAAQQAQAGLDEALTS